MGTAHQQSKEENYEPITAAEKQSITAKHRVFYWSTRALSNFFPGEDW